MKDTMTAGEEFEAALACETREQAEFFVEQRLEFMREELGVHNAEQILRERLGYTAGYYGEAVRQKMEWLFKAEHPVFGNLRPTTEEALLLGEIMARMDLKIARRVADALRRRVNEQ